MCVEDDDVVLFTVPPNPNVIKSHFPRVCTTNHQDIDGDKLFMTFSCSFLSVSSSFPSSSFLLVIASFPFYFRIVVSSLSLYVLCISISFSLSYTTFIFRLIKTETGRAILRVISGPRAFRVVLLARLTPIPFGLQNTIFGVSFLSLVFVDISSSKPHRTFIIIAENLGIRKILLINFSLPPPCLSRSFRINIWILWNFLSA